MPAHREQLRSTGHLAVEVRDVKGVVLSRQVIPNLVVNAGLNLIRDFLNAVAPTALTHFAIGTGTTAAAATDTTLQTEVFRDVITQKTSTAQQLLLKYFLGTGDANGSTLAEAGIFNGTPAGTMYSRALLSATIAKTSSISVTFNWTLTWST